MELRTRAVGVRSAAGRALHGYPYHAAVAAFAAGVAATGPTELGLLVAALAVAILGWLRVPALALIVVAAALAGAWVGAERVAAIDGGASRLDDGAFVEATATMLGSPRPSRFGSAAEVEVQAGPLRGLRLLARAPGDVEWPPGAGPGLELSVAGTARSPRTSPGSDFDYAGSLRRRGIAGELALERLEATGGRRGGVRGAIDAARHRAERSLARGASPSSAALIRGMVLGQDEGIEAPVRDDFRRAGLAHLLAVSGQNVMLLGLLATPILAGLGLGLRARLGALLGLIALYVPLAGAGPSLQRAGVMGAAGLVAIVLGRLASRSYALLLAAAGTLVLNPRVHQDPGWQLSFAAVIGILVLEPGLRRSLSALPRVAAEGIAITLAATLATAPLLAHHFEAVSIAALPANVLALPAVAPAMWIGMLQIALGQLDAAAGPIADAGGALAGVLGSLNEVPLRYLAELARRFAELPAAEVPASLESPLAVAGAYGLLGAGALAARRAVRLLGTRATASAGRWRTSPRWRRRALVAVGVAVLATGAARLTAPPSPPQTLAVSFLDVGQGDATLIQHPGAGAILFDAGPVDARVVHQLRRAGVSRLRAVVATHASSDHHGGLGEVFERFPVELFIDGGDGTTDPEFRAVAAAAEERGARRIAARAGQTLEFGDLAVRVMSPEPRPPGPPPEDPNPRAVAAVVSAGDFDLFLSGDAESPALLPLALPEVEAIKVPHHGSADPGLPELLARLRPEVAAIEVGEDNGYGHPAPSTLAALRDAGAHVYRTDQDGTITLSVESGALRVATEE